MVFIGVYVAVEEICLHCWAIVQFSIGYVAQSSLYMQPGNTLVLPISVHVFEIWPVKTEHTCLFAIIE